jgi:leader peptidase (prepilin peptidase)/N-methyltransferase
MYYVLIGILYGFVFFFGCVIGSFLNVVIYRVPKNISLSKGRSFCPQCHRTLNWYDMVPIASFFCLGGKCRACRAPISARYPLVEGTSGMLALFCFGRFGGGIYWMICFAIAAILLAISLIDWDTMEIPNGLQIALIIPAICAVFWGPDQSIWSHVVGFFVISMPMLLLTIFIPGSFGGGDIKLMAICGFALGWKAVLVAAFLGLLFGGVYGVVLLCRDRRNRRAHFPFGPFLSAGLFLAMLWGEEIIAWYLQLVGLK